jgi:hypothetical protein
MALRLSLPPVGMIDLVAITGLRLDSLPQKSPENLDGFVCVLWIELAGARSRVSLGCRSCYLPVNLGLSGRFGVLGCFQPVGEISPPRYHQRLRTPWQGKNFFAKSGSATFSFPWQQGDLLWTGHPAMGTGETDCSHSADAQIDPPRTVAGCQGAKHKLAGEWSIAVVRWARIGGNKSLHSGVCAVKRY